MVSIWDDEQMVEVCDYREVGIEERGVDVGGWTHALTSLTSFCW